MPGARCRYLAAGPAGRTRTRCHHYLARSTSDVRVRQRPRADRHDPAALQPGEADRVALHRARQTDPERLHREFQRPPARRTSQRDAVHLAGAGSSCAGDLARRLQQRPATQCPGQPHTDRVRQSQRSWAATGRDAALCRGLRAPPRCSTEPYGLIYNRDSSHCWMMRGAQTKKATVAEYGLFLVMLAHYGKPMTEAQLKELQPYATSSNLRKVLARMVTNGILRKRGQNYSLIPQ